MKAVKLYLLAGSAVAAMASPAAAQSEYGPNIVVPTAQEISGSGEGDIVVTARRREETLQDVPQTISAVTDQTLAKLNITSFNDIQRVVPGLQLTAGQSSAGLTLRGVSHTQSTAASPTVQFYLNDAPGRISNAYDIGQIEVLRGPQGTLRGKSAPSGSITVTTKRPNLNEVGGYVSMTGTALGNVNVQGAVSLPIIHDVLALRLAGNLDDNDVDGVHSAAIGLNPHQRGTSLRATLQFEPSSTFNATIIYQRDRSNTVSFQQVAGPGRGTNGPVITPGDRLGVTEDASRGRGELDFVIGKAELRFGGQKLSYVGSYRQGPSNSFTPQDVGNLLPGYEYYQQVFQDGRSMSHELRLESEDRIAGIFDYTVGGFYSRDKNVAQVDLQAAAFLAGAFGRPGTPPVAGPPNPRYILPTRISIGTNIDKELSFFGSVTAHLGARTELTAGGRYIISKLDDTTQIATGSAYSGFTNPLIPSPAFCAFLPGVPAGTAASPVYTGLPTVCDVPVNASIVQTLRNKTTDKPFIFNISASHHFSDNLLAYATVGSSFRPGPASVGLTSLSECCSAPSPIRLAGISDLVFHVPEKSTSYEIGLKASALDKRLRINVAVYRQNFKNYFFYTQPTYFLNVTNPVDPVPTASVSQFGFTANADAQVTGVDFDASFQVTPSWNLAVGVSWANAKLKNALIPCNDGNFDGTPDAIVPTAAGFFAHNIIVARCASNAAINRTPKWNATVQTEYIQPISHQVDGFVRGNFVYYPDNPNSSQGFVTQSYFMADLYAGIRAPNGAWEVAVFAKNATGTNRILSYNSVDVEPGAVTGTFGPSGYSQASFTPRREVGLNVRYAFGSR